MELYGRRLSPFYERVFLFMRAKGIAGDIDLVEISGDELKTPEYLAINPLGKMPGFRDGDFAIPESTTICEYLEAKFPEPALIPSAPRDRARVSLIGRMVDLQILNALFLLLGQLSAKHKDEALVEPNLASIAVGLDMIERHAEGGDFLVGDAWTLADCALYAAYFFLPRFLPAFGADPAASRPKIAAWHAAIANTEIAGDSDAIRQVALEEFLAERAAQ